MPLDDKDSVRQGLAFCLRALDGGAAAPLKTDPSLAAARAAMGDLARALKGAGLLARTGAVWAGRPDAIGALAPAPAAAIAAAARRAGEAVGGGAGAFAPDFRWFPEEAAALLKTLDAPARTAGAPNFRFEDWITPAMMAAEPRTLFVFGDNLQRRGRGGQAAAMRDAPNAVGLPTKRAPRWDEEAFFTDADLPRAVAAMAPDVRRLEDHLRAGGSVVWPTAGIGTGRAELRRRAPAIAEHLDGVLQRLQTLAKEVLPPGRSEPAAPTAPAAPAPPKFTFFWAGPFSQWAAQRFEEDGGAYSCAEQYMMRKKADLFGDAAKAADIMKATEPAVMQRLGREVRGFDQAVWERERYAIVLEATRLRVAQNPGLEALLLKTAGTILVEASPKDRVWGIGLRETDSRARDPAQWLGLNLLGKALTEVREERLRLGAMAAKDAERDVRPSPAAAQRRVAAQEGAER